MPPTRRELLAVAGSSIVFAGCSSDGGPTDSPDGEGDGSDGGGNDGGDGGDGATTAAGSVTVRVRSHPELGEILVDGDGMTLYMFDSDERGSGASTCSGGCAENWPPLTVDGDPVAGSGVETALTTFERDDGSTQVAANGWPLYYFASDEESGDVSGQGVGDVWWVLRPNGTPVRASPTPTATSSGSDSGGIY